jgi:hypothetical protein
LPIIGPYTSDFSGTTTKDRGDDDKIPVGSLRFLRNQAEMESDMNTRRVLAGREMTGDSGIFSEVRLNVEYHEQLPRIYHKELNIVLQCARNTGKKSIPSLRLS